LKKPWILILAIPAWAGLAFSQTKSAPAGAPSWGEHLDLVQILIAALFSIVSWLIIRTLNKIDRNQTRMFDRLEKLEKEFSELKGEHNALAGSHFGRRKDDRK
jgi:hypothetical protein